MSVDPDAPTAREAAQQQSLPAEHPQPVKPVSAPYTGPTISAITPQQQARMDADRIFHLDMPPDQAFSYPEAGIPYRILYTLKHSFYAPIADWISPRPRRYIGSDGTVKEYTGPIDHTDALVPIAQIAMLFLPAPKGVGLGTAAAEDAAAGGTRLLSEGAPLDPAVAANRQAWAELTQSAPAAAQRIHVAGEDLAGSTELTLIDHGASSNPLALARGEAGAETVVLSGVGRVGPNTLAEMLVQQGWRGGHLRLLSCGTGMENEAGIVLGEQLSLALAERGAPTVVAAPKGLVQVGSELFGTPAPVVISPRVTIGVKAFGYW